MSEFNLEDKIESWDRKEMVRFSLFCCNKVKHMMGDKSLKAVELVEKWLEDENSISKRELKRVATYATINYAYYAANTVNAACHTDDATYYTSNVAHHAAYDLNSSQEALYLEYMRNRLSNIMEG